jgi:protein phosphatase
VSLSKVEKDHPEIELKYLPPYQQKQVKATIAEGGLTDAQKKIDELSVQASACKKEAERASAENNNAKPQGHTGSTTGTTSTAYTSKATSPPNPSASKSPSSPSSKSPSPSATAPTPSPGPTLSEEEQKVVSLCGKQ